jgi:hypothetical protein
VVSLFVQMAFFLCHSDNSDGHRGNDKSPELWRKLGERMQELRRYRGARSWTDRHGPALLSEASLRNGTSRPPVAESSNAVKQKIRDLVTLFTSLFSRLTTPFAFVEMQLCTHCFFIQTKIPFHDDDIMRLYCDYRSPAYNRERIHYEPEYAEVAPAIGQDDREVSTRRSALSTFLHKGLQTSNPLTMIDYGGSDGRFIPDIPGSKSVYEISNVDPIPGVTRIKSELELGTYSIVLFAHVTEYVTHPLNLVRKLIAYVEPGGYLYIETPQEISDQQGSELQHSALRLDIGIHEHSNYYCVPAVAALFGAAGFTVVAMESAPFWLGEVRAYSHAWAYAGLGLAVRDIGICILGDASRLQ